MEARKRNRGPVKGGTEFMTVHELHDLTGISEVSLYRYLNDGALAGKKVRGRWIVKRHETLEMLGIE